MCFRKPWLCTSTIARCCYDLMETRLYKFVDMIAEEIVNNLVIFFFMQDEQEAIDLVYVFFYLTFGPWHAPGHATCCQGPVIDIRDLCQTGLVPSVVVTVTGTVTQWFCDFTDHAVKLLP